MTALVTDLAAAGLLGVAGVVLGLLAGGRVRWTWLWAAVLLVLLNNLMLSRGYRLIPDVVGGHWNWEGKLLALAATLVVASLPGFGWRRAGLTARQKPGSLRVGVPVALAYCALFLVLALRSGGEAGTGEDIAFQLTLPGLEEEPFYRGVLLLALDRAFTARRRLLGVEWGWGAVLSCFAFGLAHALDYAHGRFALDPATMALTALPSFVAVWLRYRTGSVLLPIAIHNFGNSIGLLA